VNEPSARWTWAETLGEPPCTSIRSIANIDVSRASRYAPPVRKTMPKPIAIDRRDGAIRPSHARGRSRGKAPRQGSGTVSTRAMDRGKRARAGMFNCSSPERPLLRLWQLDVAQQLDLVLEPHAELLQRAPASLGHEREGVGGRRAVGVLDEVRVLRRDLSASDPMPF
jgi:hypothetical protein